MNLSYLAEHIKTRYQLFTCGSVSVPPFTRTAGSSALRKGDNARRRRAGTGSFILLNAQVSGVVSVYVIIRAVASGYVVHSQCAACEADVLIRTIIPISTSERKLLSTFMRKRFCSLQQRPRQLKPDTTCLAKFLSVLLECSTRPKPRK